ncbi:hypothetical protein M422DRAFT_277025 [Sphaerobolus stellatus SS14]|uniref:Hydrophobin n=1 Tax=Sphaerobolus stellatus (strain SS14) TaxID=990650 RepID=A0A0C9U0N6_SPHS4|nr:hypothetical protein M422DRAFT_277025 [Sphaerobolus stellatus SS14]
MKFAIFPSLAFAILAAATPTPNKGPCDTDRLLNYLSSTVNKPSTSLGSALCCQTVGDAQTDSTVKSVATGLGVDLSGITGLVALTCDPITVIGAGGNNCAQQPVCCTGTEFKGLVSN